MAQIFSLFTSHLSICAFPPPPKNRFFFPLPPHGKKVLSLVRKASWQYNQDLVQSPLKKENNLSHEMKQSFSPLHYIYIQFTYSHKGPMPLLKGSTVVKPGEEKIKENSADIYKYLPTTCTCTVRP